MTEPTHESAMQSYHQALVDRDLDRLKDLVDDEAIFLFSNGRCMAGQAEVLAGIESTFNAIQNETYETSDIRWLVQEPNTAVCVYEYRWRGEIRCEKMSGGGRGTNVFRREHDSQWKVVHEHLSHGSLEPSTHD